eukprot:39853-Pyramimonas_sp.AAC.1
MALSSWKKTADTFGAYYLMLFRQFDIEDLHDMFFDWDDFCSFIAYIDPPEHVEELRSRRSFVSRSRCRLITNIAHGLKSNETDRFMLQVWRNYMRTLWTDENMPRSEDVGQKPAERTILQQAQKLISDLREEAEQRSREGPSDKMMRDALKGRKQAWGSFRALRLALGDEATSTLTTESNSSEGGGDPQEFPRCIMLARERGPEAS